MDHTESQDLEWEYPLLHSLLDPCKQQTLDHELLATIHNFGINNTNYECLQTPCLQTSKRKTKRGKRAGRRKQRKIKVQITKCKQRESYARGVNYNNLRILNDPPRLNVLFAKPHICVQ